MNIANFIEMTAKNEIKTNQWALNCEKLSFSVVNKRIITWLLLRDADLTGSWKNLLRFDDFRGCTRKLIRTGRCFVFGKWLRVILVEKFKIAHLVLNCSIFIIIRCLIKITTQLWAKTASWWWWGWKIDVLLLLNRLIWCILLMIIVWKDRVWKWVNGIWAEWPSRVWQCRSKSGKYKLLNFKTVKSYWAVLPVWSIWILRWNIGWHNVWRWKWWNWIWLARIHRNPVISAHDQTNFVVLCSEQ